MALANRNRKTVAAARRHIMGLERMGLSEPNDNPYLLDPPRPATRQVYILTHEEPEHKHTHAHAHAHAHEHHHGHGLMHFEPHQHDHRCCPVHKGRHRLVFDEKSGEYVEDLDQGIPRRRENSWTKRPEREWQSEERRPRRRTADEGQERVAKWRTEDGENDGRPRRTTNGNEKKAGKNVCWNDVVDESAIRDQGTGPSEPQQEQDTAPRPRRTNGAERNDGNRNTNSENPATNNDTEDNLNDADGDEQSAKAGNRKTNNRRTRSNDGRSMDAETEFDSEEEESEWERERPPRHVLRHVPAPSPYDIMQRFAPDEFRAAFWTNHHSEYFKNYRRRDKWFRDLFPTPRCARALEDQQDMYRERQRQRIEKLGKEIEQVDVTPYYEMLMYKAKQDNELLLGQCCGKQNDTKLPVLQKQDEFDKMCDKNKQRLSFLDDVCRTDQDLKSETIASWNKGKISKNGGGRSDFSWLLPKQNVSKPADSALASLDL